MSAFLPERFGWVGLGAMGWPMANQLLKNTSANLVIFDVERSLLDRFAREASDRVEIASSARQVADESASSRGTRLEDVHRLVNITIFALSVNKAFDSSTIDIRTSIAVGEAVMNSNAENPARFYDCPVSGGTAGAAKGTITFMVGAAADDPWFPLIHNILSTMGKSINPMGGKGLGLAAKLRSAANWVNSTINPVPGVCPEAVTSKDYEGGFKIQLMEKDMRLAAEAARGVELRSFSEILPLERTLLLLRILTIATEIHGLFYRNVLGELAKPVGFVE
ncbi:NAD binding domain of 6-phosphogluconate dehydrogenase-domain-containing protein [Mycena rosella]|uniref:NAD binding domain of 6-phosphogluconate dehydrogenase-domain-containing protein n=1 Tax=Mycena rosella TaxID=1033263 RepID=A0AAD7GNH2_MYCRO|nr:NAD binding domain of 6-phosphogluconate dehydrogenase-domain-containing protein [Mycena rosella]